MKKLFLFCLLFGSVLFSHAQTRDISELHANAKTFIRQGDFANAILILNRAVQQDPTNIALSKDLAFSYYYQKNNAKALEIIKPLLDKEEADDQVFQIAGNIYKELGQMKECEKMYKKGLKKFPRSGALYNEYGELLISQQNADAIKQWERGIETDPSYSKNYYNAARFYNNSPDKEWTILYGEIFINMEPLSRSTPELKDVLFDCYKRLFAEADLEKDNKEKSKFIKAFLQTMNKQSSVASRGINTETLTMIRTRFILDWENTYKSKFPFKLFDHQQQLLKEGLFDAYNQWIFGSSESLSGFQNWTNNHKDDYTAFLNFQKGRTFKIPEGQKY